MSKTYIDDQGHKIVYVRRKPQAEGEDFGPPSPCLAQELHYAIASGYEECDRPDSSSAREAVVEPDPVEESAPTVSNNAVVEPEPVEPEPAPAPKKKR